jgi:hypothetical protein
MLNQPMMNWFPFPPQTNEVQFEEKWSFVGKKEKNCDPFDPKDDKYGDNWDNIAYDPEHRLILTVIPGKRTAENTYKLIADFMRRTRGTNEIDNHRQVYVIYYGHSCRIR